MKEMMMCAGASEDEIRRVKKVAFSYNFWLMFFPWIGTNRREKRRRVGDVGQTEAWPT